MKRKQHYCNLRLPHGWVNLDLTRLMKQTMKRNSQFDVFDWNGRSVIKWRLPCPWQAENCYTVVWFVVNSYNHYIIWRIGVTELNDPEGSKIRFLGKDQWFSCCELCFSTLYVLYPSDLHIQILKWIWFFRNQIPSLYTLFIE